MEKKKGNLYKRRRVFSHLLVQKYLTTEFLFRVGKIMLFLQKQKVNKNNQF